MIEFYTLKAASPVRFAVNDGSVEAALAAGDGPLWISLINPTAAERDAVNMHFGIPKVHPEAVLEINEQPRVESDGTCILIVARTPFRHDPVRRVIYSTCPVAAIVTQYTLITVCLRDNIASDLLSGPILGSSPRAMDRLALTLLLRVSSSFIQQLQIMDDEARRMELALKGSMQNQELLKCCTLKNR